VDSSSFIYLFTPNTPLPQPCVNSYRDPILSPDRFYALPVYHLLVPAHCTADNTPQPHRKSPKSILSRCLLQDKEERRLRRAWHQATQSHHHHRSSRDSGVGSSSASDRASLGTAPDSPFTYQQVDEQRQILGAVQEALDAANEKIRQLEAANAKLNTALFESNKENRLLKREKADLHNKLDDALDDVEAKPRSSRSSQEKCRLSGARRSDRRHRVDQVITKRRDQAAVVVRPARMDVVPVGERCLRRCTTAIRRLTQPLIPSPHGAAPLPAATYRAPGPVAYATNQLSYARWTNVRPPTIASQRTLQRWQVPSQSSVKCEVLSIWSIPMAGLTPRFDEHLFLKDINTTPNLSVDQCISISCLSG
jgi:hypothetical protein